MADLGGLGGLGTGEVEGWICCALFGLFGLELSGS
jgi:hypothetical protein